ncbi:hypothetical protein HAX54_004599 [Datura stramonium]|uniref:Putative plant transposon protein domain-containing protein n=1 Tax=Datura stramonium TaxID=4076 RepID=A0ABS8T785_DATST|nr:hypothetical protein [Datura stramonium]
MAPKVSKGKGVAFSSHGSERERRPSEEEHEDVDMAPPPLRQYGLRWVAEKEGKKWFKEHKKSKYSHDMFIDRNCLSLVFSHMVDRILTLGLDFMFNASSDCNLNMVREFLENWMPKERSSQVKIRGQIIEFSPNALNRLLGTPNVDPQPFVDLMKKPPYRNIRNTLCGPNSVARWTCHQQFGVGTRYKEPLDDDVATEDEMARVDSDIESSDDDEEDSEMGEAALAPTDDEE